MNSESGCCIVQLNWSKRRFRGLDPSAMIGKTGTDGNILISFGLV